MTSLIDSPFIKTLVSSANRIENRLWDAVDKSLTYKMNNKGPSTEPCGIPHVIDLSSDLVSLMYTYCFLLLK